ncbi:hypothetical protein CDAR_19521 [Caerostris darwini]|uniref:Uncharacterized protein n=1 Tax=Caerostris darwini TaxID=1538125 RepID=A0AAV4WE88_9ARAC|nr:hypothetical protein CDAR_19521 [Caerostris darwini]
MKAKSDGFAKTHDKFLCLLPSCQFNMVHGMHTTVLHHGDKDHDIKPSTLTAGRLHHSSSLRTLSVLTGLGNGSHYVYIYKKKSLRKGR